MILLIPHGVARSRQTLQKEWALPALKRPQALGKLRPHGTALTNKTTPAARGRRRLRETDRRDG